MVLSIQLLLGLSPLAAGVVWYIVATVLRQRAYAKFIAVDENLGKVEPMGYFYQQIAAAALILLGLVATAVIVSG